MKSDVLTDDVLIIGYGNELRGDDGIGAHVANMLAALGLRGVRVLVVQQLLPELAAELADVSFVIFIDADSGSRDREVRIISIQPSESYSVSDHSSDPYGLLALTQGVYGRLPQGWLVSVPGAHFGLGMRLSDVALANAQTAIRIIRELIESLQSVRAPHPHNAVSHPHSADS